MFLCFHDKKGFTLIELLVSISIIAIMFSMVLADYRSAGKKSALYFEAHRLSGDLRRAQNMALGSVEYNGAVPAGGWGIYIVNDTTYIIFADDGSKEYESAADQTYETMTLQNGVTFSAGLTKSIVFLPPDPRTFINGANAQGDSNDESVTFVLTGLAGTKNILVNKAGLIDVED